MGEGCPPEGTSKNSYLKKESILNAVSGKRLNIEKGDRKFDSVKQRSLKLQQIKREESKGDNEQ